MDKPFGTKAVVLLEDLPVWQKANAAAFLVSGIAGSTPPLVDEATLALTHDDACAA
jgi:hypothetical protein